jgi:hypothetical protein
MALVFRCQSFDKRGNPVRPEIVIFVNGNNAGKQGIHGEEPFMAPAQVMDIQLPDMVG